MIVLPPNGVTILYSLHSARNKVALKVESYKPVAAAMAGIRLLSGGVWPNSAWLVQSCGPILRQMSRDVGAR